MSGDSPLCYSREEARRVFQEAVKDRSVIFPSHARLEMKKDKLDTNDVLNLARFGICVNSPEVHIRTGLMTYRIESESLGIKAVFVIEEAENTHKVRIVTVFRKK